MKKEQKKKPVNWGKIAIIAFGVLFAVAMIGAYMMPLVSSFRPVRANESVAVDFTIRDDTGAVILTSVQQQYANAYRSGGTPAYLARDPLVVVAGAPSDKVVESVQAYNPTTGWIQYAILSMEINDISQNIVGMRVGDTKTIPFTYSDPLQMNISAEQYDFIGGNFTMVQVGDWIPLGFTDTPEIAASGDQNVTPSSSLRLAEVINKSADNVTIKHRYGSVDVTIKKIS